MTDVVRDNDEELRKAMSEAQKEVSRFVSEQKREADTVARNGQRTLDEDKENLERLREEQSQIGAADEALEQRGREEHQRREELRRETQRLKAVEGTLGPEQQTVARSLEQQRMLLTEREHAYQQSQLQNEHKLNELHKGESMYKTWLGLEFEREDERLRVTFSNIDPQAPTRAFTFQVYVDTTDRYHVNNCEPAVPDVQTLVDTPASLSQRVASCGARLPPPDSRQQPCHATLNSTNDFSAFVRSMRKSFKLLV